MSDFDSNGDFTDRDAIEAQASAGARPKKVKPFDRNRWPDSEIMFFDLSSGTSAGGVLGYSRKQWERRGEREEHVVGAREDLMFALRELNAEDRIRAGRVAGDNQVKAGVELIMSALVALGKPEAAIDVSGDRLVREHWWKAIGEKGRTLVTMANNYLNAVTEEQGATFLRAARPI